MQASVLLPSANIQGTQKTYGVSINVPGPTFPRRPRSSSCLLSQISSWVPVLGSRLLYSYASPRALWRPSSSFGWSGLYLVTNCTLGRLPLMPPHFPPSSSSQGSQSDMSENHLQHARYHLLILVAPGCALERLGELDELIVLGLLRHVIVSDLSSARKSTWWLSNISSSGSPIEISYSRPGGVSRLGNSTSYFLNRDLENARIPRIGSGGISRTWMMTPEGWSA